MLNLLIGIVVLSTLVFIHELGHFLAAKWLKIPVLAFSIGFGKPLFTYKRNETEYRLCPIPFGGYVQMEGEEAGSEQGADGFGMRPIWQRAVVAVAGPLFNIVSAVLFYWIIFATGVPRVSYMDNPTIGYVTKESQLSNTLQAGDSILAINGQKITTFDNILQRFSDISHTYSIEFMREGKKFSKKVDITPPDPKKILEYDLGIRALFPAVIGPEFPKNSRAKAAGLQGNDTIIALDGQSVTCWWQFQYGIAQFTPDTLREDSIDPTKITSIDSSLTIEVRNGQRRTIKVVPALEKDETTSVYRIGVTAMMPHTYIQTFPVGKALQKAGEEAIKTSREMGAMLKKIFQGKIGLKYFSGPLGIMQISGAAATAGAYYLLNIMALLSLNLGLLNLMPLVITDGGVLSLLIIEKLRGRPMSPEKQIKLSYVVMALFITLFVFVTFNDILNFRNLLTLFK